MRIRLSTVCGVILAAHAQSVTAQLRPTTTQINALSVSGTSPFRLFSFSGGQLLTGGTFAPFTITHGLTMSTGYWNWLTGTLRSPGAPPLVGGSVEALDYNYRAMGYTNFSDGRITSFVLPALDVSGTTAGHLQETFSVYKVVTQPGDGAAVNLATAVNTWTINNFRLAIEDLSITDVRTVGSIMIKITSRQEASAVVITLPAKSAAPFAFWWDQLKSGTGQPKPGSIAYLSSSLTTTLMTVQLYGLVVTGMANFTSPTGEAMSKVTMSVGSVQLQM
jgi:hypothetical protein